MTKRALVLSGGGVAGIAWETGLAVGLFEVSLDVREAELIVGTSAGSTVAAQITSGLSFEELYQRQVNPALQATEIDVKIDMQEWGASFMRILEKASNPREIRQGIGEMALVTQTVPESERRAVIVSRLPVHTWPQRQMQLVAVDAHSGERVVFDRSSGIDLIDAVAASCAVPGVWPPVTIGEHRYIDGGTHSNENADLAVGYDRVLIIEPEVPALPLEKLETQVELLERHGAKVEIIRPVEAMKEALASVGGNPLDPSLREVAARIGREQGRNIASHIATFWR
ncbi:patatin-like phospholipase family protein [Ktedonospora formicarum]|uniref:Patatin n=1 Tax=Ktedonospora formicarum TaxID=2778364 RepID=A0A8J3I4J2_9CHLR|nr:patatin-like phospholipase family protein [Ktedonospora formicarum]GHO49334.1 patatin [Ktedonospora formicarum]